MQLQPITNLTFDIGYVGNRGRHGVIPVPFNQASIATPTNPVNGETFSYGYQTTDTNGNPLTTEPENTYDGGNTDTRVPYIGYGINSVLYEAAAYGRTRLFLPRRGAVRQNVLFPSLVLRRPLTARVLRLHHDKQPMVQLLRRVSLAA